MQNQWVVVADAARARVFTTLGPNRELHELHTMVHPESRRHEGDLRTGGKGESIESTSASSRQSGPQTSAGEKHADFFARELADFLKQQRVRDEFESLVLVAEPQMLGRLRGKLDNATSKLVTDTVDKDWTQHDQQKIQRLLNG